MNASKTSAHGGLGACMKLTSEHSAYDNVSLAKPAMPSIFGQHNNQFQQIRSITILPYISFIKLTECINFPGYEKTTTH